MNVEKVLNSLFNNEAQRLENAIYELAKADAGTFPEEIQSLDFDHEGLGLHSGFYDYFKATVLIDGESKDLKIDLKDGTAQALLDNPAITIKPEIRAALEAARNAERASDAPILDNI